MTVLVDDFNRADGALGSNWATSWGSPTITGGQVAGSGLWAPMSAAIYDLDRLSSEVMVYWASSTSNWAGPAVKSAGNAFTMYAAYCITASSIIYFRLVRFDTGSATTLAQEQLSSAPPPWSNIYIEWDHGHLIARLNGAHQLEADDSTHSGNALAGIAGYGTSNKVDSAIVVGGSTIQLSANPSVVGNYGGCTDIALTGANTAWTPGTPGSPIFTVNHGTIDTQTVHSATSATITFCPGDYLGPVTITDPSTGQTTAIVVTSDPGTVPPGDLCPFTEGAVDLLNDTAAHTNGDITTSDMVVAVGESGGPDLTLLNAIADLWYAEYRADVEPPSGYAGANTAAILWQLLNGGNEPAVGPFPLPPSTPLSQNVEAVRTSLVAMRTASDWTLQDLLDLIGGTDDRNLTEIYNLVSAGSSQDILDAIAALRGDTTSTVANILTSLGQLRTVNTWTLGNVKDWIEAVEAGSTDLTPVLTAISNLSSKVDSVESNILDAIAGLGIVLTAVNLTVGGISTSVGSIAEAATDILEIVTALNNKPTAAAGPPVWTVLDDAEIGSAETLADGLTITGPLDGLLVHITTAPARAGRFAFGDLSSWRYVGAVVFQSDRGDWEWAQPIGLDSQIVTPKTMRRAAAARFRLEGGWAGTARMFTVGALD